MRAWRHSNARSLDYICEATMQDVGQARQEFYMPYTLGIAELRSTYSIFMLLGKIRLIISGCCAFIPAESSRGTSGWWECRILIPTLLFITLSIQFGLRNVFAFPRSLCQTLSYKIWNRYFHFCYVLSIAASSGAETRDAAFQTMSGLLALIQTRKADCV